MPLLEEVTQEVESNEEGWDSSSDQLYNFF